MDQKKKIKILGIVTGLIIAVVLGNYVSSEFFSLRYWNPIKRIHVRDILVKAEVVKSGEKIELGLAGRNSLSEGRGMLFVMPSDDFQHFWMKGMRFSIDIIWIENGQVIGCEERVSPEDSRIFTSPGKSSFVLEVPAGFCDQRGIEVNDKVEM